MEGVNDPNPPTQAVKAKKVIKTKSKTTSGVSQKSSVVRTTKSQPEGSEQVSKIGERIGENQTNLKNKEGEGMKNQPNHVASSQKGVSINKETNTTLSTSSQKDLDIEKSSYPGAQNTEGDTQSKHITPSVRKRKGIKIKNALGPTLSLFQFLEHTHAIPEIVNLENVPHSLIPIDASRINAEIHPHSLSIQISPPHSTSQNSSDVFMIDNMEISNSLSPKLMGEPKISIDTHHSEENDLLEYQSFISSMVIDTVLQNQNLISQQPSTDKPSTNNYPSMASTSTANPSTDNSLSVDSWYINGYSFFFKSFSN